eukprot:Gb_26633 [translate_table: standard]
MLLHLRVEYNYNKSKIEKEPKKWLCEGFRCSVEAMFLPCDNNLLLLSTPLGFETDVERGKRSTVGKGEARLLGVGEHHLWKIAWIVMASSSFLKSGQGHAEVCNKVYECGPAHVIDVLKGHAPSRE